MPATAVGAERPVLTLVRPLAGADVICLHLVAGLRAVLATIRMQLLALLAGYEEMTRLAAMLAIITALSDVSLDEAKGQSVKTEISKSLLAQKAADIAREINIRASKVPPNAPVAFDSAISHDKSVEVNYIIRDWNLFSLMRNGLHDEKVRATKASYYCTESNMAAMAQGLVIHEIAALPDRSDQIDFVVDISSCDVLPNPQLADPATLAELAKNVATAENLRRGQPVGGWFRLDNAWAHEGLVEERLIVRDVPAKDGILVDRAHFEGVQKNFFCPRFRNDLLQGVAFHLVFVSQDGSAVLDIAINKSNC